MMAYQKANSVRAREEKPASLEGKPAMTKREANVLSAENFPLELA